MKVLELFGGMGGFSYGIIQYRWKLQNMKTIELRRAEK